MERQPTFEDNLGLVRKLANTLYQNALPRGYFDYEDIFQEGCIGLLKAVRSFKPDKGIKFSTYAGRCITNEILMHLRRVGSKACFLFLETPVATNDNNEEITLKDMIEAKETTESMVMARELERFYDDFVERLSEKKGYMDERERKVYKLLLRGYKQTEMMASIGISQRVAATHFKSIRELIRADWIKGEAVRWTRKNFNR